MRHILCFLSLMGAAFGQGADRVLPDIQFCTGGRKGLLMDVFLPNLTSRKPVPAVVWIHGGGWAAGDRKNNAVAKLLAQYGFVTASIDYRLSGEAPFPAAVEDCKCAVRYLRANARKYGVDADRIGVAGASAGGHLALMVALAGPAAHLEGTGGWADVSSDVSAVASWYGPTDFTVGETAFEDGRGRSVIQFLGGTLAQRPDMYKQASPLTYVHAGAAPVLMIHGGRDQTVPFDQSERLRDALKKAGDPVQLVKVEGAGHSFVQAGSEPIVPDMAEIRRITKQFFMDNLRR